MKQNRHVLRLSVLALLCLVSYQVSARQQVDSTLVEYLLADEDTLFMPVVAYWYLGEERAIEVVNGRREYENGELVNADSSVAMYRVSVIDSTEDSYRVQWMVTSYEATRNPMKNVALDEALFVGIAAEGLVVRASEVGEFQDLENREALKVFLQAVVDSTVSYLVEQDTTGKFDDPAARQFMHNFLGSSMMDQLLEQKLVEPFRLYYSLHGYEYPVGVETQYEQQLPNMFGGDPLPGIGTTVIEEVDWESYTFTLLNTLEVDPQAVGEMVKTMIRKMIAESGLVDPDEIKEKTEEMEQELAGFTMDVRDVNRYSIDFDGGWVLSLDRVRVVEAASKRREDFLRFRMID